MRACGPWGSTREVRGEMSEPTLEYLPGKDHRDDEIKRGEILRYLSLVGFKPVTPKTLLYHLRDVRYPCTVSALYFHLQYLAKKEWVELEWTPEEIGKEPQILGVKITATGVDILDRRRVGELGVSF